MRYIGKYESFFDADAAVAVIAREWTDEKVDGLLESEKQEWSDGYSEIGNGEAEEHVIAFLVSWYESKHSRVTDKESLYDAIREHYKSIFVG